MWSLPGTWHHYVFFGSPSFAADNQALMRGRRTRVYVISVQWSVHLPAYIKEARSCRTRMVCPSSLQDLSVQCIVQWCKAVCILAFMPPFTVPPWRAIHVRVYQYTGIVLWFVSLTGWDQFNCSYNRPIPIQTRQHKYRLQDRFRPR